MCEASYLTKTNMINAFRYKQFVILHGYRKKTNKAPKQEIAIALRRMEELIKEN